MLSLDSQALLVGVFALDFSSPALWIQECTSLSDSQRYVQKIAKTAEICHVEWCFRICKCTVLFVGMKQAVAQSSQ